MTAEAASPHPVPGDEADEPALRRGVAAAMAGLLLALLPLAGVAMVAAGAAGQISRGQGAVFALAGAAAALAVALVELRRRGRGGAVAPWDDAWRWAAGGAATWALAGMAGALLGDDAEPAAAFVLAATPVVLTLAWAVAWSWDGGAAVRRVAAAALLAGGAVHAAQALAQALFDWRLAAMLGGSAGDDLERGALLTLAGHPNYLGSALVVFFFLKLDLWRRGEAPRALLAPLLAADVMALALVGARGATLGVAAGVALALALRGALRRWTPRAIAAGLAAALVAAALAGLVLLLVVLPRGPAAASARQTLADRLLARNPVTTRMHSWLVATRLWAAHPVVGVGAGGFDAASWRLLGDLARAAEHTAGDGGAAIRATDPLVSRLLLELTNGLDAGHAHHELLHAGAERGTLGLLGLLAAGVACAAMAARRRDALTVGALAAVAVDAQFGFPLHTAAALAPLTCLLGRLLAGPAAEPAPGLAPPVPLVPGAPGVPTVAVLRLVVAASAAASLLAGAALAGEACARFGARRLLDADAANDTPLAVAALRAGRLLAPAGELGARAEFLRRLQEGTPPAAPAPSDPLRRKPSPRHLQLLAKGAAAAGDDAEAAALLRVAAFLSPRDLSIAVDEARSVLRLYQTGRADAARLRRAIDHLRRIDFRHPIVVLAEGRVAEAQGRAEGALRLYQRGLDEGRPDAIADAVQRDVARFVRRLVEQRRDALRAELRGEGAPPADAPRP